MFIQNVNSTAPSYEPLRTVSEPTTSAPVAESKAEIKPAAENRTDPKPTEVQLKNAVENTNKAMQVSNKNLAFSVDSDTHQTVVKLMDTVTGDVIGQFPSEQMLAISKAIGLMQEQLQQASISKAQVPSTQGMLIKQQA